MCMQVYLFNARSLANKLPQFQSFLYSYQPSVFAICETWLSDHHYDSEVIPCGYSIYRKDRGSRGGRVLLAIDNSLSVTKLSSPSDLEILTVEINGSITISVVYIPPSSHFSYFLSLSNYMHTLFQSDNQTFVVGDFNIPDTDWDILSGSSAESSLICDTVFDLNLV